MKKKRLLAAAAATLLTVGVFSPVPASAEEDYGWDHRALSVSGTYQVLRGQFAGDEATDLLFYAPGSAADSLWIGKRGGRGVDAFTKKPLAINGTFTPVVGDFAGDDYDDILWYGPGSAADVLWTSVVGSKHFASKNVKISGTNYKPITLRDYRAVGAKDDVLFLGPGNVADYLWHFNEQPGTAAYDAPGTWTSRPLKVNGSYQLIAGDYSGDGIDDVVLYQPGTKADYKWTSKASGAFSQSNVTINGTFQPVVVRKQTYDAIYFWASGTPNEAYWTSNGSTFTSRSVVQYPWLKGVASTLGVDSVLIRSDADRDGWVSAEATKADTFYLASAANDFNTATAALDGDFDGDGYLDMFWYGPGSRRDAVWYGNPPAGTAGTSSATSTASIHKVTPITVR